MNPGYSKQQKHVRIRLRGTEKADEETGASSREEILYSGQVGTTKCPFNKPKVHKLGEPAASHCQSRLRDGEVARAPPTLGARSVPRVEGRRFLWPRTVIPVVQRARPEGPVVQCSRPRRPVFAETAPRCVPGMGWEPVQGRRREPTIHRFLAAPDAPGTRSRAAQGGRRK